MKYAFCLFLVLALVSNAVCAGENVDYYKYKDTKFKKITFDEQFFSDILLEKDASNIPKYEEEKGIIKEAFPSSVITPFSFDALNTIETDNKTIIIVFRDHLDKKLHELSEKLLPIQPFINALQEDGTVVCFAHVAENGCQFLIVKQSFNFQEEKVAGNKLSGKGLSYILNYLTKVVKVSSYKSRFQNYKPGDDYSIYREVKDAVKDGGVAFDLGYFEESVYINPILGFSIDFPQWETVRKVKKDHAREERIGSIFGQTTLFLFNKYTQSPDIRNNPEVWMGVCHVKEQSLESFAEKEKKDIGYDMTPVIMKKGKMSGKDIYTIQYSIQPMDHKTGRPLDHLPPIHRKIIIFKKNGFVGKMGIMYRNDEQGKELDKILGTIQLK